ncbi:MAG: molybdopterin-dependent oxidoreductase [Desulfitobacterium sp.]
MANLLTKITDKKISRRTFLAATAAGTAGLALSGCGNSLMTTSAKNTPNSEGKWITASCWHNCGGRCLNKALVVDGVVVRQKTDDTHPDTPDYPQQRACIRGRSHRQLVFGADRLKYPMKRKHWAPGGGDKSLRGRDEWVKISWEEALDIVASEIKNARAKSGSRSILSAAQMNSPAGNHTVRMLAATGGCTVNTGTRSWGSWMATPQFIGGLPPTNTGMTINDRLDLLNSETVILWGSNPAWSSVSGSVYYARRIKEAGAKFIAVDPFHNESISMLDAEWIPIRPATDTAAMLAIAYVMITTDDPISNPLIDWEFLKENTVGFDAESMPEGSDPKDNFKDYVLGTYDGVPKSPEWATKICGVEPDQIHYLAKEFRKDKKVAFLPSWSFARNNNTDNLPQLIMTLGAMGGHMGKSGHTTGICCHGYAFNGGPQLLQPGKNGLPPVKNPVTDAIMDPELWPAVINGKYNFCGSHDSKVYVKGESRDIDIRIIYHGGTGNVLQTREGTTLGIEAHRKVDFVVSHGFALNANAQYSDVVLPITTEWERFGGYLVRDREINIVWSQVTEPLYEAKDDQWIAMELLKRLGEDPKKVYPIDIKQQHFNEIAGAQVVTPDGKGMEALVTITDGDIAEWGVKGNPQQGRIGFKEFREQGIYRVERKPGDNFGYIAYKDPEGPVPGATEEKLLGQRKLLIYSKELETAINNMGYSKIKAIPTYIPPEDGYEKTFSNWETQEKGEYPFQVMNPHYLRRVHSTLDNLPWLQEAWPNPVFINEDDAKDLGIADGDTVLMTGPHGKTLRTATLTQCFMPGVIGLPHGSWLDMDEKTGIDRGGCANILCGSIPTGQGISGWNIAICRIEKYAGTPLIPDVQKPQRIVF